MSRLSRKASAPCSNASRRVASPVRWVRTNTFVSGPLALDLADRFEPAEAGHHHVHDDDVRPFLADERDRHLAIGRFTGQRQVGVSPQDERHQPTTVHLVIDDENPWCHGRAPRARCGCDLPNQHEPCRDSSGLSFGRYTSVGRLYPVVMTG
jgi:hypothetical protein